jgi:hypothetical protein
MERSGIDMTIGAVLAHKATRVKVRQPSIEQLEEWMDEGGCEAVDGCWVEPDGQCEHGSISWMLKLGLI